MNTTNILFEECLAMVSPEVHKRTEYSLGIADRICELLEQKGISQKEFAKIMGKKESQISRWIQGTHNFTIETLAAISTALGEDIIKIPCKRNTANEFQQTASAITYLVGRTYNDISKHATLGIAAQQHSETTDYQPRATIVIDFNSRYSAPANRGKSTFSKSPCS